MNLQILFEEQTKLLHKINLDKKRYLYSKINWNLKSIGILGQRGLGKTTLMLQHIKENFDAKNTALYVSLDNPYMQSVSLFEFAKFFEQHGGKVLFVDEVHKYEDWSTHIKNIYDTLELQVVFSGSSILQISQQNSDLSRRSIIYTLENLSFREYLELLDIYKFEVCTLENVLKNHISFATDISKHIKPLMHFKEYLQFGAYPFILEDKEVYHQKIIQMINLILETDLPHINHIDISQIAKLKKLLYLLAINVPFIPNITDIAKATNVSRPKVYDYLEYLERAKVINSIKSQEKGYNIMAKPEKLFMQNTNISYAITASLDTGSAREAFFVNQIKNAFSPQTKLLDDRIFTAKKGDFFVDGKYTFEVGGKNKDFSQIKDIEDSYLALDDIEIGCGNKIPLWLFGFLY
jgi:predicted AAA+ superfamily ATPase